MNYKSLDSYLLALVMLEAKHQEEKLVGSLLTVKDKLALYTRTVCKANKIKVVPHMDKIWNKFVSLSSDGEYEVSPIMLALQLIVTNPNRNKHKLLTSLALNIAKEHRFSKDTQIKNSKLLVQRFMIGENR